MSGLNEGTGLGATGVPRAEQGADDMQMQVLAASGCAGGIVEREGREFTGEPGEHGAPGAATELVRAGERRWWERCGAPVHVVAAGLNLTYNGVQFVPGHPNHFVFTDNATGSTFLTGMLISIADLDRKARAVRAKFRCSEAFGVACAY